MSRAKKEYFFKEGCYIEEWQNHQSEPELSIAKVRVLAGQTTKLHTLINTTERYVVLSGQAIVTVGDRSWPVKETSVVTIAAGEPQKIANTGDQDLVFLALCTPRFEDQNYRQLEP